MNEQEGRVEYSKHQQREIDACLSVARDILTYGRSTDATMVEFVEYIYETDRIKIEITEGFSYHSSDSGEFTMINIVYTDPNGVEVYERYGLGRREESLRKKVARADDRVYNSSAGEPMTNKDITELKSLLTYVRSNPEITQIEIFKRLRSISSELDTLTTMDARDNNVWVYSTKIHDAAVTIGRRGLGQEYFTIIDEDEIVWTAPHGKGYVSEGKVTTKKYQDGADEGTFVERAISQDDVNSVDSIMKTLQKRMKRKLKTSRPELVTTKEKASFVSDTMTIARIAQRAIKLEADLSRLRQAAEDPLELERMIALSKLDDSVIEQIIKEVNSRSSSQMNRTWFDAETISRIRLLIRDAQTQEPTN